LAPTSACGSAACWTPPPALRATSPSKWGREAPPALLVDEPDQRDGVRTLDRPGVDHVPAVEVHLRDHEAAVLVDLLDVGDVPEEGALPGHHEGARLRRLADGVAHGLRVAVPLPGVAGPRHRAAAGRVPGALAEREL